jgi:hypothetical protein
MKKLRQIIEGVLHRNSQRERHYLTALHKQLTDHYAASKYNPEEMGAMEAYTRGTSINSYHWNKHHGLATTDYQNKCDRTMTKPLDSALGKVEAPITFRVYSSTMHDPRTLMNKEGIVNHAAYMSTSINKEFAQDWDHIREDGDQHVLTYEIPKGKKIGAYVGNHISICGGQHEFTTKRALNLRHIKTVSKKYTVKSKYGVNERKKTMHVHHMEIVGDDE